MKDDPAREDRLAAALRANLARRKARAREGEAVAGAPTSSAKAEPGREN